LPALDDGSAEVVEERLARCPAGEIGHIDEAR
jgi:hypothetical protein